MLSKRISSRIELGSCVKNDGSIVTCHGCEIGCYEWLSSAISALLIVVLFLLTLLLMILLLISVSLIVLISVLITSICTLLEIVYHELLECNYSLTCILSVIYLLQLWCTPSIVWWLFCDVLLITLLSQSKSNVQILRSGRIVISKGERLPLLILSLSSSLSSSLSLLYSLYWLSSWFALI